MASIAQASLAALLLLPMVRTQDPHHPPLPLPPPTAMTSQSPRLT